MKKLALISAATIFCFSSLTAIANTDTQEAIEYRQGIFKAFKWNFGPMADMVRGKAEFNAEEFVKRAEKLQNLSNMPFEGFIDGSYAGSNTLPVIEQKWEDFVNKQNTFESAAEKLAKAANTGDMKQIRAAFGEAGKSCKSCHDQFRK